MKATKVLLTLLTGALFLLPGCKPETNNLTPVPEWAKEAIWYQVFVERFRNGDRGNDPAQADLKGSYPAQIPENWTITPWGHDWYSHELWLDSVKARGFYSKIQARRYGGDLQGVLEKLDYIKDLGVTAIYFNPLNDSPSLHKYDARNYTHIDRNFGPDPEGDVALMNSETPGDKSTWKWTSADKLFLTVIEECHKRGMRVIMDYSWNHTGRDFWALNDVRKNREKSEFRDWYNIKEFDDPETEADEFKYEGWGGNNPWMPVFKKDIYPPEDSVMPFEGNLHSASLKQHIFNVSKRWLDPDGDRDHTDGVDGFRLDVAGEIPMGFWRDYRKVVRSVNPDAYLVGEIWWLEWPDKLMDPKIFLEGDQFDAIMNYRWYRIARGFFAQAEPVLKPSGFLTGINSINEGISSDNLQVMMNVAATHDSPRLSTSIYNKTLYKYHAKPSDNPDYKINKPDERTRKEQILLLINQFTFTGAPHIWNGDETGMWGADDPDCRKPVIWDDIVYEDETANFDPSKSRPDDVVRPDTEFMDFYRKLAQMRKDNPVLIRGDLNFILVDDPKMVLAYSRTSENDEVLVVFNRSDTLQTVTVPVMADRTYKRLLVSDEGSFISTGNSLELTLEPLSATVLKKK